MEDHMQLVEIQGQKLEVDMRTAKRVDTLRIGTRVKMLIKPSYGQPKIHPGVIVGFEPFEALPTIIVCYAEISYADCKLEFVHYNNKTEGVDIIAAVDDTLEMDQGEVNSWFDKEITKKQAEITELNQRREYFKTHFRTYWEQIAPI